MLAPAQLEEARFAYPTWHCFGSVARCFDVRQPPGPAKDGGLPTGANSAQIGLCADARTRLPDRDPEGDTRAALHARAVGNAR